MRWLTRVVGAGLVLSCGGSGDDSNFPLDATFDQTMQGDVVFQDVKQQDAVVQDVVSQDTGADASQDVTVDAPEDVVDSSVPDVAEASTGDGGGCTVNSECAPKYYCAKSVGDCAGVGTCQPEPTICSALANPICGCDKMTYVNACYGARVGVNEAYHGACE